MIPNENEEIIPSVWVVKETSTDQIADTASASFSVDSEEVNVTIDEISHLNELL